MPSSTHGYQRTVVVGAVRELIVAARRARAALEVGAPERDFYLGVEAAAEEIVHPELGQARTTDWLERENRRFQDGYLRTSASLGAAFTGSEPPLRLRLPVPPES